MNHCFCSISRANDNNGTNSLVHHFKTFAGIQHKTSVKNCGSWIRQNVEKMTKDDCMNGIIPGDQGGKRFIYIKPHLTTERIGGAEWECSLSKDKLSTTKHGCHTDGWPLTPMVCFAPSWDFSRVKFCADSKQALWMRLKTEVPHVYHAKIIHTG